MRRLAQLLLVIAVAGVGAVEAADAFSTAKKIGPARGLNALGCKGGFPDISGQCWKCPAGYKHDNILLAPTHGRVCKDEGGRDNRTGTSVGKGTGLLKTDCPGGAWISMHNHECYKCPSGFSHDILKSGNQKGVCWQDKKDKYSAASIVSGTVLCAEGGFYDMSGGGTCWECPGATPVRTAEPVTSQKACKSKACGALDARPCLVTERIPSCDKGLAEDFIANRCVSGELRVQTCKALVALLKTGQLPESFKTTLDEAKKKLHAARQSKAWWAEKVLAEAQPLEAYLDDARVLWDKANAAHAQMKAVFESDSFCSLAGIDSKLLNAGLRAAVAKSGPQKPVFMSFGFGITAAAIGGVQVSQIIATDFKGNRGAYITIGPALVSNVAVSRSFGVGVFPGGKLSDFEGMGMGWGGSAGPPGKPLSAGFDLSYTGDAKYRGGGFNGAVGAGASPFDAYIGVNYSWKVGK